MGEVVQFRLPDVGEGLTEAEIVSWRVRPGDSIALNDPLVEIETAKSLVEIPSPYAGTVVDLLVPEGRTVEVGTPLVTVSAGAAVGAAVAQGPPVEADRAELPRAEAAATAVLVGYGPREQAPTHRRRALAKPPVRKLARELGVDLASLTPSGPGGVVTRQDVQSAMAAVGPVGAALQPTGERETRIPIRSVRKATAEAVVRSAFTAPHVTEWVSVDMTRTVTMVRRLREHPDLAGTRVTLLVLVARAFLLAVRRRPDINAFWDEESQEIVVKHYVNLGIAAATARGLVVPTIKDADQMRLPQLAAAIDALVRTAREGRTPPADMLGGTVSITNIGVFGVDSGTPILPPGQSAILAFGAVRPMPWVHKGTVVPRQVTQLALSFDHRLVDGELGAKVLADVAAILEDPATGYALRA